MKKLCVVAAIAALAFIATPLKASAASIGQCPGVGQNPTGCQFLFTINPDGTITTTASTTDTGPFDGAEDTLIGVQNNGPTAFASVSLSSGTDIFGFDGDGACAGGYVPQPACVGHDITGYGGFVSNNSTPVSSGGTPVTFNITNVFNGTVIFGPNGIPSGGSAWFSLEEAFTIDTLPTPRSTAPEPTSLVLLGTGILAVARRLRKA